MAKRRFDLPGIEELNKDQDKVLRLPQDGQFLVVGGPGTGKSVVALLRTLKYQIDNKYLFLTYNHVLRAATIQCIKSQIKSDTAWSWYYKLLYGLTNEFVPETDDYKPDYEKIIQIFDEFDLEKAKDFYLIIDEGQDMPQGYYDSLMTLGYENFFIVADQNQQITDENSSRQELTDMLGLNVEDVIELRTNYRNDTPIALFAKYFYTDKASPPPDIPDRPSLDTPFLYEYELVDSCVEMMLREADRDNSKLIGLIVATDTKRDDYVKRLNRIDISRANEKPLISSYKQSDKGNVNIDFGQGGIVVLNDQSVKGIEFDVVFIVLDGFKLFQNNTHSMKKRLYVMTSRAKKKLVLFKGISCDKAVSDLLPEDESILKRDSI